MVHGPHDEEGNDPRQILKDGCGECEARGRDLRIALGHMDPETFRKAWARAWDFEHDNPEVVGSVSRAERPLLDALYCVRNQLQNSGLLPPPRTPWRVSDPEANRRVYAETTDEAIAVARSWAANTGRPMRISDISTGLSSVMQPDGTCIDSPQPDKTAGT